MPPISQEDVYNGLDLMMIIEKNRLDSFKTWHIKSGKCTKDAMAKTGFYHCHIRGKKNLVRCFFCLQSIDNWNKNNDPQEEHLKNSPNCIFAKLNKEQNYLTVTELNLILMERNKIITRAKFENKLEEYNEHISKITEIIKQL